MSEPPVLNPREAYALWASSYPPYAHNPLMQAEERAMLSLLPAGLRGYCVLDAGCGSGRYVRQALRRGASEVIGLDLSAEMLRRAQSERVHVLESAVMGGQRAALVQAGLDALPIRNGWADLTLCGLALGHLPDLTKALAELSRVTRTGGTLLCSDFHPAGDARGWKRTFKVYGQRYIVRHTSHSLDTWHAACRNAGLIPHGILEPHLDPADFAPGVEFDPAALETPVALVLALQRPLV
jgi:malonyl-CoA O-methyltransferase